MSGSEESLRGGKKQSPTEQDEQENFSRQEPKGWGFRFRRKVMLSTFGAVAFGMILTAVSFIQVDVSATRDLIQDNLHTQAESMAHNLKPALIFDDPKSANADLMRLRDQPNIKRAAVFKIVSTGDRQKERMELFASFDREKNSGSFPKISQTFGNSWNTSGDALLLDKSSAWAIRPIKGETNHLQSIGTIFIERNLDDLQARFRKYAVIAFAIAAGGIMVTMMGAIWFQGFLTRPILELSDAAQRVITKKDYSTRAEKHSTDELGDLTDVFNDMLSTVDEANQVLQRSHEQMEEEVEKRTIELTQANKRLMEEAEKREKARTELLDLHRRLQMQEKLAAVGQVSANVAHELRNPLSAIRQSLYYLDGKFPPSEKVQQHLKLIKEELALSERIISSLLEMSRERKLRKENLDLEKMLNQVSGYCRLKENIVLKTEMDETPFQVFADPTLLRHVFINLINNAQQAMLEGGEIKIRGYRDFDEKTVIEISDTGRGISKTDLPKVFDSLYTTKIDGTGLGLTLCRNIMQRHDGKVEIQSSPNAGTTVTLSLPRQETDEPSKKSIILKDDPKFAFDRN